MLPDTNYMYGKGAPSSFIHKTCDKVSGYE